MNKNFHSQKHTPSLQIGSHFFILRVILRVSNEKTNPNSKST